MCYLFGLLMTMPLVVVALINVYRWLVGRAFEPISDNLIIIVLLFILLMPAALASGIRYSFVKLSTPTPADFLIYSSVAALGSGALMTFADYADNYFTPTGVGLAWPLTGLILGASFGFLFAVLLRTSGASAPSRHMLG